jgi:hypothetical protein
MKRRSRSRRRCLPKPHRASQSPQKESLAALRGLSRRTSSDPRPGTLARDRGLDSRRDTDASLMRWRLGAAMVAEERNDSCGHDSSGSSPPRASADASASRLSVGKRAGSGSDHPELGIS